MSVATCAFEECYLAGRESILEELAHAAGHEYINYHPMYESRERLKNVYKGMMARCTNPESDNYYLYGGRGIKVCEEWAENYFAFREWAYRTGYDPTAKRNGCTIERINVDGDYCPENCKWATDWSEQIQNRRIMLEMKRLKKGQEEWEAEQKRLKELNEKARSQLLARRARSFHIHLNKQSSDWYYFSEIVGENALFICLWDNHHLWVNIAHPEDNRFSKSSPAGKALAKMNLFASKWPKEESA